MEASVSNLITAPHSREMQLTKRKRMIKLMRRQMALEKNIKDLLMKRIARATQKKMIKMSLHSQWAVSNKPWPSSLPPSTTGIRISKPVSTSTKTLRDQSQEERKLTARQFHQAQTIPGSLN